MPHSRKKSKKNRALNQLPDQRGEAVRQHTLSNYNKEQPKDKDVRSESMSASRQESQTDVERDITVLQTTDSKIAAIGNDDTLSDKSEHWSDSEDENQVERDITVLQTTDSKIAAIGNDDTLSDKSEHWSDSEDENQVERDITVLQTTDSKIAAIGNDDTLSDKSEHWSDSEDENQDLALHFADDAQLTHHDAKSLGERKGRTIQGRPEITVVQNVKSQITQIGNENIVFNKSGNCSDSNSEDEVEGATSMMNQEISTRTFYHSSENVNKNIWTQNITAKKVNIVLVQPDWYENEGLSNPLHKKSFLEAVGYFENGHFILVADRITGVHSLETFALVDWILVLDFDPESRSSGLLSYVQEGITERRSLHPVSWQEEKFSFTSNSLYWIGMKGCSDQPDTRTSDVFREWNRQVKSKLGQQLKQLKRYADDYTDLTVVVLWPQESQNYKHINMVLNEISDILMPVASVIVELGTKRTKEAESVLTLLDEYKTVQITLTDMCRIIASVCTPLSLNSSSVYKLPTSDSTNDPKIDDQKAQWLKEDLDVLYLTNKTGIQYDTDGFLMEEDNFFKGGALPWPWWYEAGPGRVDIQRDIAKDLISYIKTRRIGFVRSGCITLYHNPGSGGTTLAQRVLWTLKEDVPCVQIKQRYGATINDIAEKIEFVSDKTRMPVLVLVDGGDEQKIESVQRILGGHCCVIILYVKRFRQKIESDGSNMNQGIFKLKGKVSEKEAESLRHLYIRLCNEKQRRNINGLVQEVKRGISHSLFDFGFAMHSYEYNGIVTYVQGYLKLDTSDRSKLLPWQKALGYLSLVYYYGQTSLPIKILAKMFNSADAHKITTFTDFPNEMQELMVRDVQDRRTHDIRVSHHYIAEEILNQILVYPMIVERPVFPSLSTESKKRLGKFAVEFIRIAGKLNHQEKSSTISHIMTRTFILRDNKAVGENETQVTTTRQKFSQILEDACSNRPYTERFDIYQALTDCFPLEAQFRAHLGRLYTHCRPEEMDFAEKCFIEALDTSKAEVKGMSIEDIPYSNKMELKNIYHMYGNMILNKVSIYTGKYMGDKPKRQTESNFVELSTQLLPDIKQSAELFFNCRDITPIGCEESHGYIGEIQVRLMFCDYVHRNSGYQRGVCQYVDENVNDVSSFVKECIVTVDELFLLCFSNIEPEKMDRHVIDCQKWYSALFQRIPGHYIHSQAENAKSRRLEIAKVKMKYCQPEAYGIIERVDNVLDIEFIVVELEKNLNDYENKVLEQHTTKRAMDLDYREWLCAIRHNLFAESYPIEKVLQQVQIWHDILRTPYSWFYLFVLKSLLGLGKHGDPALLNDAKSCKEEMLKHSKHVTKPKYPREWLGSHENGIRRLVSGRRFFGQVEGRDIKGIDFETLEVHKGTICAPNDRPAGGYIDLDLGPENRVSLKVFFIPARSEDNLKGPAYKHHRVEFVIGFSLLIGYEAFNVKLLEYEQCLQCQKKVEKRSCDTEVECPRCNVTFKCKEIKKTGKPGRNGSLKKS